MQSMLGWPSPGVHSDGAPVELEPLEPDTSPVVLEVEPDVEPEPELPPSSTQTLSTEQTRPGSQAPPCVHGQSTLPIVHMDVVELVSVWPPLDASPEVSLGVGGHAVSSSE